MYFILWVLGYKLISYDDPDMFVDDLLFADILSETTVSGVTGTIGSSTTVSTVSGTTETLSLETSETIPSESTLSTTIGSPATGSSTSKL